MIRRTIQKTIEEPNLTNPKALFDKGGHEALTSAKLRNANSHIRG